MRQFSLSGFLFAVCSAASFALSGICASALIDAGWTAGAAAAARIVLAAAVLAIPTCIAMRGQWWLLRRGAKPMLLFGLLAIAGCQLTFFLAIQFIPPSLALIIEFMGPVLLLLWSWMRTRVAPSVVTLFGALLAIIGLITVTGLAVGGALHPLGVLFALGSAVGNATFYAIGASSAHGLPPLPFVGLGLAVGAVALIAVLALGVLPFAVTANPVVIAATELPVWVPVTAMVLISTVLAYVLGVGASRRLGATVASFTGYSEALFGIIWTIVFLSLVPTPTQWLGAALVIAGVVTVKIGELKQNRKLGGLTHSRELVA